VTQVTRPPCDIANLADFDDTGTDAGAPGLQGRLGEMQSATSFGAQGPGWAPPPVSAASVTAAGALGLQGRLGEMQSATSHPSGAELAGPGWQPPPQVQVDTRIPADGPAGIGGTTTVSQVGGNVVRRTNLPTSLQLAGAAAARDLLPAAMAGSEAATAAGARVWPALIARTPPWAKQQEPAAAASPSAPGPAAAASPSAEAATGAKPWHRDWKRGQRGGVGGQVFLTMEALDNEPAPPRPLNFGAHCGVFCQNGPDTDRGYLLTFV